MFAERGQFSKGLIYLEFVLNFSKLFKTFQMNPDMQLTPTLQRVHELHQAGHTQRAMAEILDREAVPLPPGRSKKWNQPGVRACLQQLAALAARPAPAPAVPTPVEVDPTTPPPPVPPPPPGADVL